MPNATIESATYLLDGEPLPYRLVRSRRRHKWISYDFRMDRGISVSVPAAMSDAEIAGFLQSREDWLRDCMLALAKARRQPDWSNGDAIPFRGKEVQVIVDDGANLRRRDGILVQRSIDGCELRVSVPDWIEPEGRNGAIEVALGDWYMSEAKQYLPQRLAEWSELTGLSPSRVRVGNARTRWGSCSGRRTISLRWELIKLPDRLSDYVIVHELAHLREMNHQRPFWDLVESIIPDAKLRRKELRNWSKASEGQNGDLLT